MEQINKSVYKANKKNKNFLITTKLNLLIGKTDIKETKLNNLIVSNKEIRK